MARHHPRACFRCQIVKPPDAFDWSDGHRGTGKSRRRRAHCRECVVIIEREQEQERLAKLARAAARAASWTRDDGVRIRRCSACREVRVEADWFYVERYRKDGKPAYHSQCRTCSTKRLHAYSEQRAHDPETAPQHRADRARWQREWRARNPEQEKERAARYSQRVAADVERAQRRRDMQRIDYRIRAQRAGRQVTANVADPGEDSFPRLPVRPIADAITLMIDREDRMLSINDPLHRDGFGSLDSVCRRLGVLQRTFTAWRSGERLLVTFDHADQVLTRAGWLWWEVYNEETVRLPIFRVVKRVRRKAKRKRQPDTWVTLPGRCYGDRADVPRLDVEGYEVTDHATLALVERAFTGEEIDSGYRMAVAA